MGVGTDRVATRSGEETISGAPRLCRQRHKVHLPAHGALQVPSKVTNNAGCIIGRIMNKCQDESRWKTRDMCSEYTSISRQRRGLA